MNDTATAVAPRTIEVAPGSELARLLEEADGVPLVLVKDGVRYRLDREEPATTSARRDPGAAYDPERLMAGIRAAAGSFSEEEAERRIAEIYRWRAEGSRPPDRP